MRAWFNKGRPWWWGQSIILLLVFNEVVLITGRAKQAGVRPHEGLTLALAALGALAAAAYLACSVAFFYYRAKVDRSDTPLSPDGRAPSC